MSVRSSQLCRFILTVVTTLSIHSARQRKATEAHPKNLQKTQFLLEKYHQSPDFTYIYNFYGTCTYSNSSYLQSIVLTKNHFLEQSEQTFWPIQSNHKGDNLPTTCPIPGHCDLLCLGCSLARTMLIWKPLK